MATKFTVVFDCDDPERLTHFWAAALGYQVEGPPPGFASWTEFWTSKGVPLEEAGEGDDRLSDPSGAGPQIWFHKVEEKKSVKNRLHLDLNVSGGYEFSRDERARRVNEVAERLVALGATWLGVMEEPDVDHYAVEMLDPEGNEFDLN